MSAAASNHGNSAVQTKRGIFLGEDQFIKTLAGFIRHSYANGNLEAKNYASISYLLLAHGMACRHPDADVLVGVTPQNPFDAKFGTSLRRRSPDWSKTLIFDQDVSRDHPDYRQPQFGAIWEDKVAKGDQPFNAMSRKKVADHALASVSNDLRQLREQALCAFLESPTDKFYAFLSYRDCWFLFEFYRPSDLEWLRSKYTTLFEAGDKVKESQTSSASAPIFEDADLPIPGVEFAGEHLLSADNTELSIPLRIAFGRVRARLGVSVDQSSPFWVSPDASEGIPQTSPQKVLVEGIINELKKPQKKPVGPSTATDKPQQRAAEPEEGAGEPQQGAGEPQQEAGEPQQEVGEPQQGAGGPQQGATEPQEGTIEPEETSVSSESQSGSASATSQDSHSSDDDYQSESPSLSSSTGSNDSTIPDSLLGDLSLDASSNEVETTEPRAHDHHQETADGVLDELANPDASSNDGTEIVQVTTASPPRRGRAHSIATGEDPLVAEPASDETGVPKATVRRSTRSRKNIADSGPGPTEKPSQMDALRRDHRARSPRGPGSSNVEDRATDQVPAAGPPDGGLADVSEASNAAIETENAVAASSERRVQPQAATVAHQKEDSNSNVDVGDRTTTTGLPRRDTEVVGDPEADDGRPRVRSSARLAAQSKNRRDNPAARSVAQKSSLPKPRRAASGSDTETRPAPPTGKKRKVPAGGNARVTAATGRSTLAGPSNAQTPAARGRTGAPRGRGANRKKKDQDA